MSTIIRDEKAQRIYEQIADLPIIDYHCHLSPEAIYRDEQFSDIGDLWLSGDHYKWRLMRTYGIEERLITDKTVPMIDRLRAFLSVLPYAFGNPQQDWCRMEAQRFFDIDLPLCESNAEAIFEASKRAVREYDLRPSTVFRMMHVEYVATTDDPLSDLRYHRLIREEGKLQTRVVPSFRYDAMINIADVGFPAYVNQLFEITNTTDISFDAYLTAVTSRLDFFVANGCRFADMGLEYFPTGAADYAVAKRAFYAAMRFDAMTASDADSFMGYMFVYLGKLFAERGIVSQWHMMSFRNGNSEMLRALGRDTGFDSAGDVFPIRHVQSLLDAMSREGKLPRTVLYTLNPAAYYPLVTLAGSFRDVTVGISWWFLDHKRGIRECLDYIGEVGHICGMVGMLTDSRSFLSYPRHDYFRQLLAQYLADNCDNDVDSAIAVARRLAYTNARDIIDS